MLAHQKEHWPLGFGNEGELALDLVLLEEQRIKMSKKKKDKGLRAGFCGAILLGKILISAFSCKKSHKNSFDYTEAFSKIL